MQLAFTKMHGLGNDFVVVDNRDRRYLLEPAHARFVADRRRGVGCDQLLIIERPTVPDADVAMRIVNADGGEVQQCGNGARCVARYAADAGWVEGARVRIQTAGGLVVARLERDGQVTVDMGPPRLEPAALPFVAPAPAPRYALQLADAELEIGAVSMGNPHAVMLVPSVAGADVEQLGPAVQSHERFPQGVNVGFLEVIDRRHVRLRVYERGAGETQACGTGACAAVVVGRVQDLLDDAVDVDLPGGRLHIAWDGEQGPVWMTGPATRVFEGTITI